MSTMTREELLRVTEEQLSACTRVHDTYKNVIFYLVHSAHTEEEYEVHYTKLHGLTCSCKAGQYGTPCWHKRAAVEADKRFKATEQAVAEKMARESLLRRLEAIKPLGATKAPQSSRAFQLMR